MLAHIEAGDAELTRLASDRAQQAKDWLETTGKIPGERLFIAAPRIGGGGAAGADDGAPVARPAPGATPATAAPAAAPVSRVDLSLK